MNRIAIAFGVLSLLASFARADPPPGDVVFELLTTSGTGCPPGTAAIRAAPDATAFDVEYSRDYTAALGVGTRPTDLLKSCSLSVSVRGAPGHAFAIASVDHRGFASLPAGATARYRTNSFFHGRAPTPVIDHALAGPLEEAWEASDTTDDAELVFGLCDAQRTVTLTTNLRVIAGSSDPTRTTSFVSLVNPDGTSRPTTYHLTWRQCP